MRTRGLIDVDPGGRHAQRIAKAPNHKIAGTHRRRRSITPAYNKHAHDSLDWRYIGTEGKRVQRDVYVKVHSAQDRRERGVQTGNFYSRRDKHELTDKVETRHSGAGIDDGAER